MRTKQDLPDSSETADSANAVARSCRGQNSWTADPGLRDLLGLYLPEATYSHFAQHWARMGEIVGGRLDELAESADRNPPVLHARDRSGRDEDWIDYHPAYREMEEIAFGRFALHAMSHRPGVLGWPEPAPPLVKYAFTYLFVQAEFGLMCPISLGDTAAHVLGLHGDEDLKLRYLTPMLSDDPKILLKGSQFMTERAAGSDVGAVQTVARQDKGEWRLHGDKWFCSHADADVALLLARPEGAPDGTKGLGLFLMPRRLPDGRRNTYRIARLKDKLGTRSMASGEILLEGAVAYPVGRLDRGFRQMMDQVNLSRLSHGVRAAGMMRRCSNEAVMAARTRVQFRTPLIDKPLVRRQLMKILVPTEQALSMFAYCAHVMGRARNGDEAAEAALRLLTPMFKYRACRDNIPVATASMEMRGGNGYIAEWPNERFVREAQIGVLWEGTSNINALDAITRAVGKNRAHEPLRSMLGGLVADNTIALPDGVRDRLENTLGRACELAASIADGAMAETGARRAASALYHATTAVLLAWEGARLAAGEGSGDARRLLICRMVLDHRLAAHDPLDDANAGAETEAREDRMAQLLLSDEPVSTDETVELLAAR